MYAILPAAGYGTRFLPWSKSVPKEMLPVGDRPVIHEVVREAADAGVTDIVIVLSKGKEAISHYFTPDPEFDAYLESKGKAGLMDDLNALLARVRFHYVEQKEMKGLGDAILCGLSAVPEDSPFAVLLPDTIITGKSPMPDMVQTLRESGKGSVATQPVPAERAVRYGICGGSETQPGSFQVTQMIEKPDPEQIPCIQMLNGEKQHMAFAARYVFPASLRQHLENTAPGRNNEIQLTDAMATLLADEGFHAHLLQGKRLDIGNPEGLVEALTKRI